MNSSKRRKRLFTAIILCAVTGVVLARQDPPWAVSTPEQQGVDSTRLARMLSRVCDEQLPMHGFVLVRHGYLVAEAYAYPYSREKCHVLNSVTKTVTGMLVGIALDRGLIASVDQTLPELLPDWMPVEADARMRRIRVRHLLTMSTGHRSDIEDEAMERNPTGDWFRTLLEFPVDDEPGTAFHYNTGASCLLAAIVHERSGRALTEFAERQLFGPLEIREYRWETGPGGLPVGGWGLFLRPIDMAKLGCVYLDDGRWRGTQIVSKDWVQAATRKQIETGKSGEWGSGYGYQTWMNAFGGCRADGRGGQYIYVLPEYDAVVVFTAGAESMDFGAKLMREFVLPAMKPDPLPENPAATAAYARLSQRLEQIGVGSLLSADKY